MPVPRPEELRIELAQRTLAAKGWGDPALPPLLALHGWLDNAGSFDRLAPLIAGHRRIVALDLPGHGRSTHRPPGARYHFVDYFDDVRDVLDHFGWARAGLLGHSLGAAVASLFGAAFPERIDELVLIEGLGPLTVPPERALEQLRNGIDHRAAEPTPPRIHADLDAAAAARSRVNALTMDAARTLVARGLKSVPGGVAWSSDPRLVWTSPQRYTEDNVLAMLSGIRAPSLLVIAEPDTPIIGAERMRARIARVNGLEVASVAGNHHVHLENAAGVAAAIEDFLKRRDAIRGASEPA